VLYAGLVSGCALHVSRPPKPFVQTTITLSKDPIDIRLIPPAPQQETPILTLFVTGDGGWRSLDEEVFKRIGEQGFAAAGFSASRYLKSMSEVSDTTTPRRLARDFQQIIRFAKQSLNLPPDTRVVMVGISRGAGLVSIAAGQDTLRDQTAGIIAIALGDVEDHVVHRKRTARKSEWVAVETYVYLRQLTGVPVEILQSTHDKYTTARKARELIGADTPLHHLHAIDAASHTFKGGLPPLLAQLKDSLDQLKRAR